MTTLNPSEATSLALNTITSQIRLLADMPAEHCKQAVAGLEPIVTANLTMISEAANAHIDEFNDLIGELEARDRELEGQTNLVGELRQQVASTEQRIAAAQEDTGAKLEVAEAAVYAATRKADGAQASLNAANIQIRELERRIKAYKEMDPEGLKRKVTEQRKKLEERLAAITAGKNEISGYRRDNTRLSASVTELTAIISQQQADLDARQQIINDMALFKDVSLLWGKHLRKHYTDEKGVRWNIYVVEGGIQSDKSYLLNDLDWKLHAMRSDATGCTVMLSEWLSPVFPGAVAQDIPMEAIRDIHSFMLDALAITHPQLQPRAEWAQTVHISEIGLNAKVQCLLEGAGITDLWKLMVNQSDKLLAIKGIGIKLADQIISAGHAAVRQWEQDRADVIEGEQPAIESKEAA
ncbi:hypothetical protein WH06_01895 [Aeromonas salmonicida subsp. salmonicida]|uniref:Phage protein n=2 Tax=Aeromonas salmonicida subsp. salmonicida TaxID=29491 RepID=A0ABN0E4Y8_AERSS|nr:hypothetical protein [Aeromonas salmonicida]AIZ49561.1 putative phage protein [Aeromonas salmonicida subsp. salmonicida]AYO63728.1 hypothetical protein C5P03_13605 [Aeromonas salmonicida subsp. salmonicida 01-B526]EHI54311.1 hypothetical protein IYQ_00977 [Aeromonas salmonicida subsp. salmonicida 01-B526]OKA83843.1 hypothetical protein BHR40_03405 [Aeromonas salmonicida subsp. salmonicida]OSM53928.1 hypothetical protein WH06_01895 [Aeromonas salmonicida subsp. salmonicida]